VPKQFHQLFVVISITFTVQSEHYGDIQQPANHICQYFSAYLSYMILQLKSVNTYGVCPERFATLSILKSKSRGNVYNFCVVTFECSTCYCKTVEQYTFSHNHRASSKWCGMAMCVLNNTLLQNFLRHNNKHLQAVKKCIWYQCS